MADVEEIKVNEVVTGRLNKPTHRLFYAAIVIAVAIIVSAGLVFALRKGNKKSYGIDQAQSFASNNTLLNAPGLIDTLKIDVISKGSGAIVDNEKSIVGVVFRIFDPVTGRLLNSRYSTSRLLYNQPIFNYPSTIRSGLVGNSQGATINYYIPSGQTREIERGIMLYEDYTNGMVIELKILNVTNI